MFSQKLTIEMSTTGNDNKQAEQLIMKIMALIDECSILMDKPTTVRMEYTKNNR